MNIGKLKNRISFMKETITESPNGFKNKSWTETKKAWAEIKTNKRLSLIENEKQSIEESLTFTVRYCSIEKNEKIQFNGKLFSILTIEDANFEKRFLTITAKEME